MKAILAGLTISLALPLAAQTSTGAAAGGAAGVAGSAGTAATAGAAGAAGAAGSLGTAGRAGSFGAAGTAGSLGTLRTTGNPVSGTATAPSTTVNPSLARPGNSSAGPGTVTPGAIGAPLPAAGNTFERPVIGNQVPPAAGFPPAETSLGVRGPAFGAGAPAGSEVGADAGFPAAETFPPGVVGTRTARPITNGFGVIANPAGEAVAVDLPPGSVVRTNAAGVSEVTVPPPTVVPTPLVPSFQPIRPFEPTVPNEAVDQLPGGDIGAPVVGRESGQPRHVSPTQRPGTSRGPQVVRPLR